MIESLAAAVTKGAEVTAEGAELSKVAETGKAAIDISKRIDVAEKNVETKTSTTDIAKRISPKGEISDVANQAKELTPKQIKDLIDNGMSPGIVNDCKYQDGVFKLKTINEKLENTMHPESGVKYIRKEVNLNGMTIEGVFPKFESIFTAQLSPDKLIASDGIQFKECITQLQKAVKDNPSLKEQFSPRQIEQIESGITPGGYTWHHNENVGKMELVKTETHDMTKHTGGKAVWGGGSDMR